MRDFFKNTFICISATCLIYLLSWYLLKDSIDFNRQEDRLAYILVSFYASMLVNYLIIYILINNKSKVK